MSKVVDVAIKQVGTAEKAGNMTKYGEWFGLNGVPWCGIFVSWCYYAAGIDLPRIGFSKPGFAGCQSAVAFWTKCKKVVSIPKAGDIVFFDFNGDGRYDHTGIYVRHLNDTQFESVEGNTSVQNQANGGTVMVRRRSYRRAIFVRP